MHSTLAFMKLLQCFIIDIVCAVSTVDFILKKSLEAHFSFRRLEASMVVLSESWPLEQGDYLLKYS